MDRVDEIAKRAAERILPEHFYFEDDTWFSCPKHPDSAWLRADKGDTCQCALDERRVAVAAIVREALEQYGSIVRSAHETASNS